MLKLEKIAVDLSHSQAWMRMSDGIFLHRAVGVQNLNGGGRE